MPIFSIGGHVFRMFVEGEQFKWFPPMARQLALDVL